MLRATASTTPRVEPPPSRLDALVDLTSSWLCATGHAALLTSARGLTLPYRVGQIPCAVFLPPVRPAPPSASPARAMSRYSSPCAPCLLSLRSASPRPRSGPPLAGSAAASPPPCRLAALGAPHILAPLATQSTNGQENESDIGSKGKQQKIIDVSAV
ncbi:hypothetical protein ZWY2020_041167 [Hordeum vulgare]|nr:hypothetical protein ZWY2020_041167 [Hordeum vulgare]